LGPRGKGEKMRNKRGVKVMCHALGVLGFLGFSFIFSFFLGYKRGWA